ncbi:MAG: hypothetical protein L0H93_01005 [Nocardioides sp.]|nr:hypothetical protein [Nocardioides sp.]
MPLRPLCPRCPSAVTESGGIWACSHHGTVPPLWRTSESSYDAFGAHLGRAEGFPTYLPWPMRPAWRVTDFGVVTADKGAQATLTAVAGVTEHDGPVEVVVVSEEPGIGLGARCAGTVHSDPGAEIAGSPPTVRVRIDSQSVPLWAIGTAEEAGVDRSVVAGEAGGRWLWLVIRPASAIMLLRTDWRLADVSGMGVPLLELPFGGPPPSW